MICEAMEKVGKEGVITGPGERGPCRSQAQARPRASHLRERYISAYFVTDAERMETVLEDPYVLVVNSKIGSIKDLIPLLDKVRQVGKPVLIVAEDVEGEALATLVLNHIRRTLSVVAVKAPGFGDRRKAMLGDSVASLPPVAGSCRRGGRPQAGRPPGSESAG